MIKDTILDYFKQYPGKSISVKDLGKALGVSHDNRREIRHLLRDLVRQGNLKKLPGKRYAFSSSASARLQEGRVRRNAKGFGWLIGEGDSGDAFIPPPEMDALIDGDRVRCRIEDSPKGPVAFVAEIVERGRTTLIGSYERRGNAEQVLGDEGVIAAPIRVKPNPKMQTIAKGMLVEVEITQYPEHHRQAEGKIIRVIGKSGEITTEIEAILADKGVLRGFSEKAHQEAKKFGKNPSDKDTKGRTDLTGIPLCTIDGETAKDFDDAVAAKKDGDEFVVTVAIADVSHYVAERSQLDKEAYARATSLYYPGRCVPMLPEELSNGLCSLKPNVPRLCLSAQMRFDKSGTLNKLLVHESVMNSRARLTYNQVQRYLDKDATVKKDIPKEVQKSLDVLIQASRVIRKQRLSRGAIDFDLAESHVALDEDGEPVSIHPEARLEAHRMIEDLMVATNEAIANYLIKKKWPGIFRIHEPPDPEKLQNFFKLAQSVGALDARKFTLYQKKPDPKALAKLIAPLQKHKAKFALDSFLLRSMMQAKYSADNLGHFGLASKAYLHFTSPIRRYPDLAVHRLTREALRSKKGLSEDASARLTEILAQTAIHCSDRERKTTEVEREIDRLHSAWIMRNHVGEEDDGAITSCTDFGFFVRLTKQHVEGLVHITTLPGHWDFDPETLRLTAKHSKKMYSLGDPVRVKIAYVDINKRHIDLQLVVKST